MLTGTAGLRTLLRRATGVGAGLAAVVVVSAVAAATLGPSSNSRHIALRQVVLGAQRRRRADLLPPQSRGSASTRGLRCRWCRRSNQLSKVSPLSPWRQVQTPQEGPASQATPPQARSRAGPPPVNPHRAHPALTGKGVAESLVLEPKERTSRRWRPGLAVRLAALHAGILTVVLVAVGVQVDRIVAGNLLASVNTGLVEELAEYGNAAAHRGNGTPLVTFDQSYLRTHQLPSGHAVLLAVARGAAPPRGAILGSSGSNQIRSSALVADWLNHIPNQSLFGQITAGGVSYRVLVSPVLSGGQVVGAFIASADLTGVSQAVASQLVAVIVEGAVALIAAVLTAYLLLRRVLRVVDGVTTTAADISESDLTRRLAYQGPDDEVGRLARTFDRMLERLSASFAGQRRLLADVSHQLRTPLTVIRGHLELLLRDGTSDADEVAGTLAVVLDELDGTALLVDRLLLLGRALEPEFLEEEPIALGSFLADILDAGEVLGDRNWVLRPVPPWACSATAPSSAVHC